MKRTSLETLVAKETTKTRTVSVEIPGEFLRKVIPVNSSPEPIREKGVPGNRRPNGLLVDGGGLQAK